MPRVPVEQVLASMDQQVQPRQEFSNALLVSLLDELEAELDTIPVTRPAPPAQQPSAWWRLRLTGLPRVVLAGAVALLLAIGIVVVDFLPGERSASAVVREARTRFAQLPPFEATVERHLPGEAIAGERGLDEAPDLVVTREVSYLDDEHWRTEVTNNTYDDQPGELGDLNIEPSAGSFTVADGEFLARYLVQENSFQVGPLEDEGLGDIRFDATASMDPALHSLGDPAANVFDEKCDEPEAVTYAGRSANRIHCVDLQLLGTNTNLWFDVATGLVLRVEAELRPGEEIPATEGVGLFHDVVSLNTNVNLSPDDFEVEAPDGARVLWIGEEETPEQFRTEIDPDVTALIEQRGAGGPVVSGGDYIWATGLEGGTGPQFTGAAGVLARIDPSTSEIVERIPLEYFKEYVPEKYRRRYSGPLVSPVDLEIVGDELWVVESHNGSDTKIIVDQETNFQGWRYRYWISRFDLATGEKIATSRYEGTASGAAVGETGVWLSSGNTRPKRFEDPLGDVYTDFGSIVRVDPTTGEIEESVEPRGGQWSGAFTAAYGSVWASWTIQDYTDRDDFGRNVLLRVDERTLEVVTIDLPTGFYDGRQTMVAARGSIWITVEVDGRGVLLEIDPKTNRIVDRVKVGRVPFGLAFGEGFLWCIDMRQNALRQIDPRTARVVRTVKVPAQPTGIAVGHGAVWVNTLQDGIVARVDIYR